MNFFARQQILIVDRKRCHRASILQFCEAGHEQRSCVVTVRNSKWNNNGCHSR